MNGFYTCERATDNLPPNIDSAKYGTLLVLNRSSGRATQLYTRNVADAPLIIAWRIQTDSGWSDWQFENPPMLKEIIYKTTEQYNKAIVYKKIDTDNTIKWSIDNGVTWKSAGEYLGAAPSGFGLGTTFAPDAIPNNDFNQATANSWYGVSGSDSTPYTNGPTGVHISGAVLFVLSRRSDLIKHQYLFLGTNGKQGQILHRYYNNGTEVWSEWEWVNPRMDLGVEYRTTERYQGKPVYVKLVNCGQLPNATEKTISGYAENVERVVDFNGISPYFGQSLMNKNFTTLNVAIGWINIACTTDLSAGNAEVWVKYTKTTD